MYIIQYMYILEMYNSFLKSESYLINDTQSQEQGKDI